MMKGMPLCHKLWEPLSALEWKWVVQISSGVESKVGWWVDVFQEGGWRMSAECAHFI